MKSMINEYEFKFTALCPVDRKRDNYAATLTSSKMIPAEKLQDYGASQDEREIYQEDLAKELSELFDCSVLLIGWHNGVKITSRICT